VLYAIYQATADRAPLDAALGEYRRARISWAELAEVAKGVYTSDITAGEQPWLRGCWQDRLVAIDEDIAAMAGKTAAAVKPGDDAATERISRVLGKWPRVVNECRHTPPQFMIRGSDTPIEVSLERQPSQVVLYYRRVSQAERFERLEMKRQGDVYRVDIPAAYTKDSAYPIQYYFEFHEGREAWLFPTISETLVPQPYLILAMTLIVKEIM